MTRLLGRIPGERVDRRTLAAEAAEIAATFCGSPTNNPVANLYVGFGAGVDHLRNILDTDTYARTRAAMVRTSSPYRME